MSSAVMNETDAGASVTGWVRSEAPNTCPASTRISSSRLRSGSACACAAAGMLSRATTTSVRVLASGIGVIFDKRREREQPRAELEMRAPRAVEIDPEADPAVLDIEL